MNYASIKSCDIANGPGVRVSLFVSGCTHHCKDCFNEEAWDFSYGEPFTDEVIRPPACHALPRIISGASPTSAASRLTRTIRNRFCFSRARIRQELPEKSIWAFTGYVYGGNLPMLPGITQALLEHLDVLVDGPFIAAQKNLSLRFRGSSNQRLIDMPKTLAAGTVVLWDERQ